MASKNFYYRLLRHVVFITIWASCAAYFFFDKKYEWCVLFAVFLLLQSASLIKYVNHSNRKIAYFFESVKNEDFTLRFPEYGNIKSLKQLNKSLNMVNNMIQKIHLKNKAQEKYYQEILKQADIGIMTVTQKGHILYANPRIEKLLNYKPLNHIQQLSQVDNALFQLFKTLEPFQRKLIQLSNERGKTHLALKSTSVRLEGQNLLLVVVQDIHKELDEKETDSWVKLIRVLTHEIMNTITPITSISQSILNYYKPKDDLIALKDLTDNHIKNTVKGLEVVKDQGNDLMEFVQSYRSFLSLPAPDKQIIVVAKLLDKIKLMMDQEIDSNIEILLETNPEDLELYIDDKQISQILINLCKNAIQSIGGQEKGKVKLYAGLNEEGNRIISVYDNGPGIPKDLMDEIFVPFFTTKNTGTGIGLSLSKQIMHLHGGSVKAYSVPNEHTVFTLLFN